MANIPKVWNGTAFIELEAAATVAPAASTTVVGIVQLSDSTSTTSSVLAATPTAVKSAYDLANAAIPKTLTTTTGDIIYASAANTPARLGIGTASQVLSVSGGVPAWTTPAGGGMTLIATATPSGASSVSFTSIPGTYKHLVLIVAEAYQNSINESWSLRFNNDSSNYQWNGAAIGSSNDIGAETNGNALPGLGYHNHAQIQRTTASSSTYSRHGRSHTLICRYSEAENKTVFWTSQGYEATRGHQSALCSGQWRDASVITRVDLVATSTQTVTGKIFLYGVS